MNFLQEIIEVYGEQKIPRVALFNSARSFMHQKRFSEALEELERALLETGTESKEDLKPSELEIWHLQGICYENIGGDQAFAIKKFIKIALDPRTEEKSFFYRKAHLLLSKRSVSKIQGWIEELELDAKAISFTNMAAKEKSQFLTFLGFCNFYINKNHSVENLNWTAVEDLFHKAIRNDQENALAFQGLGDIQRKNNSYSQAVSNYNIAIKLFSEQQSKEVFNIFFRLLRLHVKNEHFREAEILTRKLFDAEDSLTITFNTILHKYPESSTLIVEEVDETLETLDVIAINAEEVISTAFQLDLLYISITNLIIEHHYSKALEKITKILDLDSNKNRAVFLKSQCLIESQLNIEEGIEILKSNADQLTNLQYLPLQEGVYLARKNDANHQLFQAFHALLINKSDDVWNQIEGIDVDDLSPAEESDIAKNNPDLGLNQLKIAFFYSVNELEKAACLLYEVGLALKENNELGIACRYFSQIDDLINQQAFSCEVADTYDSSFIHFHFEYANALYSSELSATAPYYPRKKVIKKALETWQKSRKSKITESYNYWYYEVIAFIHEANYTFEANNNILQYWWALLFAERALIVERNRHSVNCLARFNRNLRLFENAKALLIPITEENPDYVAPINELILVFLDTKEPNHARSYFETIQKTSNADTYLQLEALIYFHEKNYSSALKICLHAISDSTKDQIWYRFLGMLCYWRLVDLKNAKSLAREILENIKPQHEEFLFLELAWVSIILEAWDKAQEYLTLCGKQEGRPNICYDEYIYILLAQGMTREAETRIESYLVHATPEFDVTGLIHSIETLVKIKTKNNQINTNSTTFFAEKWLPKLRDKHFAFTQHSVSPIEELQEKLSRGDFQEHSIPWLCCHISIARIFWEQGDLNSLIEAIKIYQKIGTSVDFPESQLARKKVSESIIDNCKKQWNVDQLDYTIEILLLIETEVSLTQRFELEGLIAAAYHQLDDHNCMEKRLQAGLQLVIQEKKPELLFSFLHAFKTYMGTSHYVAPVEQISSLTNKKQNNEIFDQIDQVRELVDWEWNQELKEDLSETKEEELHPFIDDLLVSIRKRTGEKKDVEEFVLPNEFIPGLKSKLLLIQEPNEKKEVFLSILAFSIMIEKKGWPGNAYKIRELTKVLGDFYDKYFWVFSFELLERTLQEIGYIKG